MSGLPSKKISKIKVDNSNTYDIVPSILQDGSTNNKLSVPTLISDNDEVVTTKTAQDITGQKTFSNDDGIIISNPTDGIDVSLISSGDVADNNSYLELVDANNQSFKFDLARGNFSTHYNAYTYNYTLPETNGTVLVAASPTSNKDKYLHTNASTGDLEWSTVSFTDTNYYATSNFNSSNGTKIATGYSSGTASTIYDLYAPNATDSQAGLVTTGAQTFAGDKVFTNGVFLNSSKTSYLNATSGVTLHSTTSLNLESGGSVNITPAASNGTVTIANGKINVGTSILSAKTQISFSDSYSNSGTTVTANYTFPTLSKAAGNYIIATTDYVSANPATTSSTLDSITINGTNYAIVSSAPANMVTTNTAQTISGQKTFSGSVILQQEPLRIDSDNHTTHTGDDWDAYYYSDKIEIYNNDSDDTGYLLFPDVGSNTETIATLSDIPAKSTDVNQFGDYYVSPTQVRQYQATIGIVQNDLLTNINGHSVSSLYEVDPYTSYITIRSKSYPVKKIINKSSGSILSFDDAHNYMRKMTGSEFTPVFDESVPQYTYIMDASGTLYKPQWDQTNGLVLWIMSAVSLKRYKHQIRIKQAYAQGGEPKIYFINNSSTAYTSYSSLWSALRHNVSELWVENSGGTISWRTVVIENSTIYWLGSSNSFMSQTINSSNFYQWEDVITQIDY